MMKSAFIKRLSGEVLSISYDPLLSCPYSEIRRILNDNNEMILTHSFKFGEIVLRLDLIYPQIPTFTLILYENMYAMVTKDREISLDVNILNSDCYEYYDENGNIYSSEKYEIIFHDIYTLENIPVKPISVELLYLQEERYRDIDNPVFIADDRHMFLKNMVDIEQGDRKWDKWFYTKPEATITSYMEAFSSIELISSMEKEVRDYILKEIIGKLEEHHNKMYYTFYGEIENNE